MSIQENKDLAKRYMQEVYVNGNLDFVDECVDCHMEEHEDFGDQKPAGLNGIKELVRVFRAAFPDINVTIEDEVAEGDKVFFRASWEGTHAGMFAGLPPTGKRIYFSSMDEIRVRNGKIVEHWGVTDTTALMAQLGAISMPAEYPGGSSLYLDG